MILHRVESRLTNAGFSTKLVESLTCGCPVITNKTGDIASFVIEGFNGFTFDPTNIEEALTKALSITKSELLQMKQNSLDARSFDFHKYIHEFGTLFNQEELTEQ